MDIHTVYAFTRDGQGGNAAGVVFLDELCDHDKPRSDSDYIAVAKQVGFSETVFVSQNSPIADFHCRFFTPVAEVVLCGHATIAAFWLMLKLEKIKVNHPYFQQTLAGVLPINILPGETILMGQSLPQFSPIDDIEKIVASLGITKNDLAKELPIEIVSTGLPDIIIPVKNRDVLYSLQPTFQAITAISLEYDVTGYHVFCLDPIHPEHTAHCRNFAPRYDIPEEPATGSASGALGAYLFKHQPFITQSQPVHFTFEQGDCQQQPSLIQVQLTSNPEGTKLAQVQVGGTAIQGKSLSFSI